MKIAHIDISGERKQSIIEHLENVAEKTQEFSSSYNIPTTDIKKYAYNVGLAHDIGKYSSLFQKKINGNGNIFVDHSTAGAKEMINNRMVAGAFAIAGHHGGIPNGSDITDSNLMYRIQKREVESYTDYKEDVSLETVKEPKLSSFEESFFIRMIFSALVDADFLDTERFMTNNEIHRGNYDSLDKLYNRLMSYVKPWRSVDDNTPELNKIRTEVLEQCICMGKEQRGLFSLTIPTGGGKTISSLAFALQHAKQNNMDRIIYVIPYTSIIEQTVEVFRNILGSQNVLAHYSNSYLCSDDENNEYYERHKLSIENWDAPIIVTTNVQFFESLFSNKVSKCRKLHNISNSVIVFDEVQMIPLKCTKPCTEVIKTLVNSYCASAVLCTATQPALEKWLHPLKAKDIYPNHKELFTKLKRNHIDDIGIIEDNELSEAMNKEEQILAIVNSRFMAQKIYKNLPDEGSFHLSTYMTPSDRKNTMNEIRQRLKMDKACRVISTSLVEAGVDLDFPVVYREKAGLDSIVQAAGRCNREGKRDLSKSRVTVFRFSKTQKMIEKNVSITEETYLKYKKYDSLDAIHYYFCSLQKLDEDSLDQYHVLESFEHGYKGIKIPFKYIGDTFHLISEDTRMLIIPIENKADGLVRELIRRKDEGESIKDILRKLGEYSINIYTNQYKSMIENNSAYELLDGIAILQNLSLYTRQMGLCYEDGGNSILMF